MKIGHDYQAAICQIVKQSDGADKFAHTYVGFAIWLSATLLLRRRGGAYLPLLIVTGAELLNECIDRLAFLMALVRYAHG